MKLYVTAITNVPDLTIDYIEVKLKSGKTVSLNWDRSYVSQFESDSPLQEGASGGVDGAEKHSFNMGDTSLWVGVPNRIKQ